MVACSIIWNAHLVHKRLGSDIIDVISKSQAAAYPQRLWHSSLQSK